MTGHRRGLASGSTTGYNFNVLRTICRIRPAAAPRAAALALAVTLAGVATAGRTAARPDAPAATLVRHGEFERAWSRVSPERGEAALAARILAELGRWAQADSLLSAWPPLGDEPEDAWCLQRARLNVLAGRPARAMDLADRAVRAMSERDDALEGWARLVEAQAAMALGEPARALDALAAAARSDDPALADRVERARVEALAAAGDPAAAVAVLERIERRARKRDERARLLAQLWEMSLESGRTDAARRAALRLAREFPMRPETGAVIETLAQAPPFDPDVELRLSLAEACADRGDWDSQRALVAPLASVRLSRSARERVRLMDARRAYARGAWARAAELARPAYHDPSLRRLSTLVLARAHRRAGHRVKAARLYRYFARTWPNDPRAVEALDVAASLLERAGARREARRVRAQLLRDYPSSAQARRIDIEAALDLLDHGRASAAARRLERRVRRTRGHDEGAVYFLARALERTGDVRRKDRLLNQLREYDPYSFYLRPRVPERVTAPVRGADGHVALDGPRGLVAFLERADSLREGAFARVLNAVGEPAAADFEPMIRRARAFFAMGFGDWAEAELEAARRRCGGDPAALLAVARAYDENARAWHSTTVYQRVRDAIHWKRRRPLEGDFRALMYPVPYPAAVFDNAARYGLPPHVAWAMMREESRFDADAVSRAGAVGLMQLMPSTARRVAGELDIPGWSEEDLTDPRVNIAFGVWYAADLLERSRGRIHRMLAAYNAGPSRAARWFDGRRDVRRAVESIEFRETHGYVRRIVESSNVYYDLYFSGE